MYILEKLETLRGLKGQSFGAHLYNIKCNKDGHLDQLVELTKFLSYHYKESTISVQQRFYHVWFNFYKIETCPYCDSPRMFAKKPKFSIDRYGIKPTNPVNYYATCMSDSCSRRHTSEQTQMALLEKYGSKNPMKVPGSLEKLKATNQKKYGVDFYTETQEFKNKVKVTFDSKYGGHPTKLKSTQDKKKKTNLEKYGFENSLDNPEIKEKSRITNNEKYGGNSSMCSDEVKNKSKATNQKKHGVDWYLQSDDFKKKFTESMLEKYGVEHAMHYTPSFEKSMNTSYRKKIFVFPSGRIENIQGYEGFALNELLDSNYLEDDIIVSNKEIEKYTGLIKYEDSGRKIRKYYPDIYVVSENKIIEVKSKYTYETNIGINKAKKEACLALGLAFEFWIYDSLGNKAVK